MKRAQILVLAIALAAGGVAAYLVAGGEEPPPAPPPQAAAPQLDTVEVLVASDEIVIGQTMMPQAVRWQTWPTEAAKSPNFIRKSGRPNAVQDIAGSITRVGFSSGEPIREDKLIRANGSGYMAAVLPPGMRAFSTSISPETGAGGFILPNDRVDVLLIRSQKSNAGEAYNSETILSNVRVLAIDQTVEEKNGQRVVVGKIATLALTARDSETLALAARLGTIALALRSLADSQQADSEEERRTNLNVREGVNIVRYGQSSQTLK